MRALIKTKSNYRNLNGTKLKIEKFEGRMITCLVYVPEHGKEMQVVFSLGEVVEITND